MPKSRTRTKPTQRVITNKEKAKVIEAYHKKCNEYFDMELADLLALQKSKTIKGVYLKALLYIIGHKMSEKSYGPLTPVQY